MKRVALIAVLIGLLVLWHFSGLGSYLTFDSLNSNRDPLIALYAQHPLEFLAAFFAVYLLLAALSVPGAAVMTIGAGALLGLLPGVVVVSFASASGATLAFLMSRYLFRDAVQTRFERRMEAINRGIASEGPFYLLSLRLVPVVPFFLVNLLMGLTPIKTWTFYWVSQIGMILGTVIYVNAGTRLGAVHSVGDVLSPGLLVSLLALGMAPWLGKWVAARLKRRRLYARWRRPRRFDRNLVVIGGGSAGLVASLVGATARASVTLVEADKMGGDCLNTGCVPSKAIIRAARVAYTVRHADRFGIMANRAEVDFPAVMACVNAAINTIEPHDSAERYNSLGVDVVAGYAKIVDPWTVEITRNDGTNQRLTTRAIVIAAGAEPFVPDLPGLEGSGYLTSENLWVVFSRLKAIPRRIVVLGGGPIGCELSQALARLGAEVSQVERGPRLLPREDADVSELVLTSQRESGVTVLTGHEALRIESVGPSEGEGRYLVTRHDEMEIRRIGYDALIVAVGRKARLTGYGLEELGIETARTVNTEASLATNLPNIFAAGDVAGPYQFTHTAAHQAWYAGVNALLDGLWTLKADYRVIPWTTFTDPEVARVGINEREAAEAGIAVEVTRYALHELDRAITDGATSGFVKVLTPPGKDHILGATIVGEHAGEMLAEFVLAMQHGLGLNKILGTIHTYPTLSEAARYTAGAWKKAHAPEGLLELSRRFNTWRRG